MTVLEPCLPFADFTHKQAVTWDCIKTNEETFNGFFEGVQASIEYLSPYKEPHIHKLKNVFLKLQDLHLKSLDGIWDFIHTHFFLYENKPHTAYSNLFTGYYEPEVRVSRTPCHIYTVPIYKRPPSLLVIEDLGYFREAFKGHRIAGIPDKGTLLPFYSSKPLWENILAGQNLEIAWAASAIDVFFMHVQGSGKLIFTDGTHCHVTYDGTNGYPYTSLGKIFVEQGRLGPTQRHKQGVQAVLKEAGNKLVDILSLNESYVFFKELKEDRPYSRLNVPLIPHRSAAVDPTYVPLGSLLWIDTPLYKGFRFAHDVGVAIKGPVRADLFCGQGITADTEAGRLQMPGRLFELAPL